MTSPAKFCTTCGDELEGKQRTTCDPCKRNKINAYHRQWEKDHPRPKRSNRLPPNSNRTTCNVCGKPLDGSSKVKCKACFSEYMKQYRETHPQYKQKDRNRNLLAKYGLTEEQFDNMWAAQEGKCGICGRELVLTAGRSECKDGLAHVDHNHDTGEVRGLLCNHCNVGLGYFGDSIEVLQAALAYLSTTGE